MTSPRFRHLPPSRELTKRQRQVAMLVFDGHNTESIAHQLDVSECCIREHLKAIFWKLSIHSRLELALTIRQNPQAFTVAPIGERAECKT